jgi:hypothetical protein
MDLKFFLVRIKNIVYNPVKTWVTIDTENRSVRMLRDSFMFPLLILVSLSAFAGSLIYTNTELSPVYSIFVGVKCFILLFFTIYVSAYIFREITYPLDLGRDFTVSFTIILFSLTPLLICQILSRFFESLLFVNIMGLYGLYIFWAGVDKLLTPPQYKKMPLLIATTVIVAAVYIASDLLLNKLADKIYYAFFSK